jgi:hypothetical protein
MSEWWIGANLGGSGRGLILRYYPCIRLGESFCVACGFNNRDFSNFCPCLLRISNTVPEYSQKVRGSNLQSLTACFSDRSHVLISSSHQLMYCYTELVRAADFHVILENRCNNGSSTPLKVQDENCWRTVKRINTSSSITAEYIFIIL